MRSIDERGQDYTMMKQINSSIAELGKQQLCTDCCKQETKEIFKQHNFDKAEFLRENLRNPMRPQIINIDKFKYP